MAPAPPRSRKGQVCAYNTDLPILRESGCTSYEKPFLYLFYGKDRVAAPGAGARETNVAEILSHTVGERCARRAAPRQHRAQHSPRR